jgi:hypothetical protein
MVCTVILHHLMDLKAKKSEIFIMFLYYYLLAIIIIRRIPAINHSVYRSWWL